MNWDAFLITLVGMVLLTSLVKAEFMFLEWASKEKHGIAYGWALVVIIIALCAGVAL